MAKTMPGPLVCAAHDGRRRVVAATDAHALVPGLAIIEPEVAAVAAALTRLAAW